jgi:hypothetical protein
MADSGNTEHHHDAMIVARRMTDTPETAVRKFGSGEVRCSVSRTLPLLRLIRIPFTIAHNLARYKLGFGHREMGPSEKRLDSSAFRRNGNECRGLIIPWSKVRALPGPPLPIEIMALWH